MTRLARYFVLVLIGYSVDLAVYALLTSAGIDYYLSYLASFLVGAGINVVLLRRYFAAPRMSFWRDYGMTLLANGAGIAVSLAVFAVLLQFVGIPHLIAKIASSGVSFVLNYFSRRLFF